MTNTVAPTASTAKCLSCGRKLTAPRSVAAGRGPKCRAKIARAVAAITAAAQTAYKPEQVVKAVEVIELGAIIQGTRPASWLAMSSRGDATYTVDAHTRTCTCPAGEHGRRCYHLAAADILATAS